MNKPTIPFHPPFNVFVGRIDMADTPWEATVTGLGDAKYLYGQTPLECLLKATALVEQWRKVS